MSPIIDLGTPEDISGMRPLWAITLDGYRYVLYSGQRAQVFKGDSQFPTYTVEGTSCTCPAGQYRPTCKHRELISWLGDEVSTGQESGSSIDDLL